MSTIRERPIFNLVRVYLQSGALEKALECFEKSVAINPNNEDAYYYLGVYYNKTGDNESTIEKYQKSIEINDNQPEAHLNLGICYFRLNMFEKALEESLEM